MDDDLGGTDDPSETSWNESMSDELRGDPGLADIKDLNGLASSYLSSQRMLGSRIPIPGEDASDEQVSEFHNKLTNIPGVLRIPDSEDLDGMNALYSKLGRPDKVEGYEYERPDMNGIEYSEDMEKGFLDIAHKNGMNKKAVTDVLDWWNNNVQESHENLVKGRENAEGELKKLWGGDYNRRIGAARKLLTDNASDEVLAELEQGLGNNPHLTKMLSDIAMKTLEDSVINTVDVKKTQTNEEIDDRITELQNNEAYFKTSHPDHAKVLAKVTKLYQQRAAILDKTG